MNNGNRGFEASSMDPRGSWTNYLTDSSLGSWVVASGNIDIQSNSHRNSGLGAEGKQHLNLNGSTQGEIRQTIRGLSVGKQYTLSFRYAIHPLASSTSADIKIANLSKQLTANNKGNSSWLTANYQFTASSSNHILSFAGVGGLGYAGLLLDDIKIY